MIWKLMTDVTHRPAEGPEGGRFILRTGLIPDNLRDVLRKVR